LLVSSCERREGVTAGDQPSTTVSYPGAAKYPQVHNLVESLAIGEGIPHPPIAQRIAELEKIAVGQSV
jgi:hypothetical protein